MGAVRWEIEPMKARYDRAIWVTKIRISLVLIRLQFYRNKGL